MEPMSPVSISPSRQFFMSQLRQFADPLSVFIYISRFFILFYYYFNGTHVSIFAISPSRQFFLFRNSDPFGVNIRVTSMIATCVFSNIFLYRHFVDLYFMFTELQSASIFLVFRPGFSRLYYCRLHIYTYIIYRTRKHLSFSFVFLHLHFKIFYCILLLF